MLAANCLTTGPTPAGASYEWGKSQDIAEVCTFVHTVVGQLEATLDSIHV